MNKTETDYIKVLTAKIKLARISLIYGRLILDEKLKEKAREISDRNNRLMTKAQHEHFIDITQSFLSDTDPLNNFGTSYAKKVTKNGKTYYTDEINRITLRNHERENAEWYLSIKGGSIEFLPDLDREKM